MSGAPDAAPRPLTDATTGLALPTTDPTLFAPDMDIAGLAAHWRAQATLPAMTGEEMRGADARAQRLGTPGEWLMEQAGCAVAAAAYALLAVDGRSSHARALILCGPGNNGGDGLVAARWLAERGIRSEIVLLSAEGRPDSEAARVNWDRLEGLDLARRVWTVRSSDVALYVNGIERAGLVIDALLGTGIRGIVREPISTAIELAVRARSVEVPVLAVDTPTSVDLTSGEPSDPVVRADVTVTFHRPKQGLLGRAGRILAGRVLVAPIGIPTQADRA